MRTTRKQNGVLNILAAMMLGVLLVCSAGAEEVAVEDVPMLGTVASEPVKAEIITTALQEASAAEPVARKKATDRAEGVLQEGEFPRAADDGARAELQALDASYIGAIERIAAGMRAYEPMIDIEEFEISRENLRLLVQKVLNGNPDLFYVDSSYGYEYDDETFQIYTISPIYKTQYTEADTVLYKEACADILSRVDPSWSDFQKMLFLHDYIVTHCEALRSVRATRWRSWTWRGSWD